MSSRCFFLLVLIATVFLPIHAFAEAAGPASNTKEARAVKNMNAFWEFRLGKNDEANKEQWEKVHLPHSFSMPYFMSPYFHTGEGWYRKTIKVDKEWMDKIVALDFEGVFQVADVYVNGERAGGHRGGYTPFRVQLTPLLKEGDNEITVRVDNSWNPKMAPRAGEHCFSGGIYRDVELVVNNPVHIPFQGTWIRTRQIDVQQKTGTVTVETQVVNSGTEEVRIQARHLVYANNNAGKDKNVEIRSETVVLKPGERKALSAEGAVSPIRLWSPRRPDLYEVETRIIDEAGGTVYDGETNSFGFRTTEWTADKGFFLNGEHTMIWGANVHQDHAGWGDAVTDGGHRRDVRLMKEAGFNFIRGSHYPHDPAFVQACDEAGMMFLSEGVFWGMGGAKEHDTYWNCDSYPRNPDDREEFEESCIQQMREMILAFRNNPSVMAWSVGNEAFFTHDQKEAREFAARLIEIAKKIDPDRPACMGGGQRGGFDKLGDIACYNGDGAHVKEPGMPSFVSEYGSVSCKRPGEYAPGWGDMKGETYPWRAGQVIWCGFDHGSIWPSGGRMGIVDYFRIPKRSWYWYRNEFRKIPPPEWPIEGTPTAIRLESDKEAITSIDGRDDAHIIVTLVDKEGKHVNAGVPVTLTIDGPGEFPTGKSITFTPGTDIDIIEGRAAIEMRAYYSGKTTIRATADGLKTASLSFEVKGNRPYKKGASIETIDRPYQRFTQEDRDRQLASTITEKANLATNRPCKASSNNESSSSASDGDMDTFWQAAENDKQPQWTLDMEFEFDVERISLDFPDAAKKTITIAHSRDGNNWTALPQISTRAKKLETSPAKPIKCRYISIRFENATTAKLAEVLIESTT